jgi:hypothetical protein
MRDAPRTYTASDGTNQSFSGWVSLSEKSRDPRRINAPTNAGKYLVSLAIEVVKSGMLLTGNVPAL